MKATAIGVLAVIIFSSNPAQAAYVEPTMPPLGITTTEPSVSWTSIDCADQVRAIATALGESPSSGLAMCSGESTLTQTTTQITAVQASAMAAEENLSADETNGLVADATAGKIYGAKWGHAYWSGSIYERHAGTTYWDGSKAWIAKHRSITGRHDCHAEGSWAVGAVIDSLSCSKPGPGTSADAIYKFDIDIMFKGSPISFTVGLHMKYTNKGVKSFWQVGG